MGQDVIGVDLAEVLDAQGEHLTTLAWGDSVEVLERGPKRVRIALADFNVRRDGSQIPVKREGTVAKGSLSAPVVVDREEAAVLKVDFVDVQQGDAAVIESPRGEVILVDGGDNQLFARYLAGRYRGTSAENPKEIACIVVSHGDADHFSGLTEIRDSESNDDQKKQLFIQPLRVYHNGLVKRPGTVPVKERLGATAGPKDDLVITGLEQDLLAVADREMNGPFKAWKRALKHFSERGSIAFRRLQKGDDDAFDFLAGQEIGIEVLGPVPTTAGGKTGLKFLGEPNRKFGHPSQAATTFSGHSVSHTINGHSIVLRLAYGDWHVLFAGDLNEQSEEALADLHEEKKLDLRSEVFKVPHHGSADFLPRFLRAVEPVVSVVSSGDEREHIHPRATLMSGLGKYGRDHEPLVFVTEMVASFKPEGFVKNDPPKKGKWASRRDPFFAFSRAAFGLVRVRTNGQRLLVYTNSGQARLKEAYAFTMGDGKAVPQKVVRA
ncbi:MAG: MBL fold metallo-hydrolase [Actinomycetota bacterium]|nr:MBL fold metallo-hydrolase [Actinomycetota bacterium]MDQ3648452.1 MBL fold metallo-hydrolase [Actinomycetota bacterium]